MYEIFLKYTLTSLLNVYINSRVSIYDMKNVLNSLELSSHSFLLTQLLKQVTKICRRLHKRIKRDFLQCWKEFSTLIFYIYLKFDL